MDQTLVSGDTEVLLFTVKDENDAVVNLSGATIIWAAFPEGDDTAALTKTIGNGIEVTDAAGGEFSVTLDADDSEDFEGKYFHEAQITFGDGTVSTVRKANRQPGTLTYLADLIQ